ncbi:ATP-binding protein [Streptomyces celluloflavus]|uniref:ATP-binding protein n=2 Tax=Streptomyces TaxID=1883 RepID=A0A4Q9HWA8_STRKA|nr:ATP-binding protein [Streptomyces kasugaensis]MYU55835.1 ATP-binding protein [Streptomyces sp. SID7805]TBO59484.1 ATP-binding protein [Streptomyces kasugaensis]WSK11150.1 ATP-binding protein [Streptomyces celluloflavus]
MIRQPSRHCSVELQALPARIGHVRRIVSAQLRYWRLDALIDPASLGVTELLANVHRHARPSKQCTVELYVLLDQLTVSVHDLDPRLPRIRAADTWETSGRGLSLVAALSESWGVRPDGCGKVVWFTLPTLGPAREEVRPVPACWDTMPLEARTAAGPRARERGTKVG